MHGMNIKHVHVCLKNCDLITCGQALLIINVLRTFYRWTGLPVGGASRHQNVSERNSYVIKCAWCGA
jgi:hypothetical protein